MRCHGLRYFALVVGEYEVHSAAVYVEVVAQILPAHCRTLAVPAWETVAPGAGPAHDVLRLGLLPQGKVGLVALLSHPVELPAGVLHVVKVAAGEYAVMVFLVVFRRVEVYASVALVGKTVVEYLLHKLFLLDDMPRGVRLYAGRQHVQCAHRVVVTVGVILRYFHRLQLFQPRLFLYFILAFVCVVLQVAHVGDVADVPYLVAKVLQVTEEHVECDCGARVPEVRVAVDGRAADVHAHVGGVQRLKAFLTTGQRIVD